MHDQFEARDPSSVKLKAKANPKKQEVATNPHTVRRTLQRSMLGARSSRALRRVRATCAQYTYYTNQRWYLGLRFTPSPFASSRPPLGLIILTGLELDLPLGRVKPPGGLALPLALTHPHLAQRLLLHL